MKSGCQLAGCAQNIIPIIHVQLVFRMFYCIASSSESAAWYFCQVVALTVGVKREVDWTIVAASVYAHRHELGTQRAWWPGRPGAFVAHGPLPSSKRIPRTVSKRTAPGRIDYFGERSVLREADQTTNCITRPLCHNGKAPPASSKEIWSAPNFFFFVFFRCTDSESDFVMNYTPAVVVWSFESDTGKNYCKFCFAQEARSI